jgi:hypothetical protein
MDNSEVLWTRKSKSRRIEEVEYRAPPKLFNCYIGKNQWVDNKGIIYYKDTDVDNENDQDDSDSEGYENDDYPDSDEEECEAEENEEEEDMLKPIKKRQRLDDQAYVFKQNSTKKEENSEDDDDEDEDEMKEEVKMLVEDAETICKQIELEKEKRKKREKCLEWQRRAELDLKSWKSLEVQDWKMSKQRGSIWNHDGVIDLSFGFQKKNSNSVVYCNMVENGWYCSSCKVSCPNMREVYQHLSTNHT